MKILTGLWIFIVLYCLCATASGAPRELVIHGQNRFQDHSGRVIDVTRPFGRIISLYTAHTENLYFLGAQEQVVGVSLYASYPDGVRQKPAFSARDDVEKFLAARPDLVLIRPMIDRGYPQLIQRLESSGIVVVSLQPGNIDQMLTYWRILGLLSGHAAQAEEMVVRFQTGIKGFEALAAQQHEKKTVYFEAVHDKMKTFSPQAMPIYALEMAGGINVAADAEPVRGTNIAAFGKEKLLSRGERIDVFLSQKGVMNNPGLETIRLEPGFQMIRAVRLGQIYEVDEDIVARPTFRLLEGIYAIGAILYPETYGVKGRETLRNAKCQISNAK